MAADRFNDRPVTNAEPHFNERPLTITRRMEITYMASVRYGQTPACYKLSPEHWAEWTREQGAARDPAGLDTYQGVPVEQSSNTSILITDKHGSRTL